MVTASQFLTVLSTLISFSLLHAATGSESISSETTVTNFSQTRGYCSAQNESAPRGSHVKVAFLFLTMGTISHEQYWQKYLLPSKSQWSLYIHPKDKAKVSSPWLVDKAIDVNVPTQWGHLTNAYIELFRAALLDCQNTHFNIVSDSHLPIRSFDEFALFLGSSPQDASFADLRANAADDPGRVAQIRKFFTRPVFKHSGWFTLSRRHAELLVSDSQNQSFQGVNSGDEFLLSILAQHREQLHDQCITYVDWTRAASARTQLRHLWGNRHQHVNDPEHHQLVSQLIKLVRHPHTFERIDTEAVDTFRASGCFFMRKASSKLPAEDLRLMESKLGLNLWTNLD